MKTISLWVVSESNDYHVCDPLSEIIMGEPVKVRDYLLKKHESSNPVLRSFTETDIYITGDHYLNVSATQTPCTVLDLLPEINPVENR